MKTHGRSIQAHGMRIKTFESALSSEKEANTPKDAGSKSNADLQGTIEK